MAAEERALSVSDAMRLAKGVLEKLQIRVLGEVSECTVKPGYKAVYFTLRDEYATLPCLMWRDAYAASGIELRPGVLMEVSGSFTAYAPKGRMQFQVRSIAAAGEGVLRLQVAMLARRLEAEGLMSERRKRPLAPYPVRIGLVTSPRGKAVHDVIRTLRRRYPLAELVIAGVQVEGEAAPQAIADGLRLVAGESCIDAVILCRGGGSYEDLMPFNSEVVARAVAASPVPVVTGIGHEPDNSIADMVADLRASTPTAAAEAVAPTAEEVASRVHAGAAMLARALRHRVAGERHRLELLSQHAAFTDPTRAFATRMQMLDLAADALARAIPRKMEHDQQALAYCAQGLRHCSATIGVRENERLSGLARRFSAVGPHVLRGASRSLETYASRLDDLSPVRILKRGYAVCYDESGTVLRSIDDVSIAQHVNVRLTDGRLACTVDNVQDGAEA